MPSPASANCAQAGAVVHPRTELGAGRMQRKATKEEAAKFVAEFGDAAHEKALEAERDARRKKNLRLAKFLEKVARRIAIDGAKKGASDAAE